MFLSLYHLIIFILTMFLYLYHLIIIILTMFLSFSLQLLTRENDKLVKKCELLTKEVTVLHSVFSQYLPDHVVREVRKQLDVLQQQHQHLMTL